MTLLVRTARVTYAGADRFDVTRKSGGPAGAPFAPSWSLLAPMIGRRRRGEDETDHLWEQYVADDGGERR